MCRNDFEGMAGVWLNKGREIAYKIFIRVMSCISSDPFFAVVVLFLYRRMGFFPQKMLPVCRPTFVSVATPVRPRGISVNWSVIVLW